MVTFPVDSGMVSDRVRHLGDRRGRCVARPEPLRQGFSMIADIQVSPCGKDNSIFRMTKAYQS
jgi:hypothetical protein